ncbi:MAG: 50S ribosomal protein L4 [Acidimicrobiales bacterium]
MRVDRRNDRGDVLDTVELDASIFGVVPNVALMHQVVKAQLAARRAGTQSTKTRAEVAGGGAKPYRQKGTGRARQGTTRAPQFAGGGVALGPKPRSYAERTPRKMIGLALASALSDRAQEGRVVIVDRWSFEVPRTKDALAAMDAIGLDGSVMVVLGNDDTVAERSFANLREVELVEATQLTAYGVLANKWIVFTTESVPGGAKAVAGSARPARAAVPDPIAPDADAGEATDESGDRDDEGAEDVAVSDEIDEDDPDDPDDEGAGDVAVSDEIDEDEVDQ